MFYLNDGRFLSQISDQCFDDYFGSFMTSFMWIRRRFRRTLGAAVKKKEKVKKHCCLAATRVTSQLNIVGFSVTSATNRLTAEDGNSIFSPSQRSHSLSLFLTVFTFVCFPFVVDVIRVEILTIENDSVASLSSSDGNGRRNCRE